MDHETATALLHTLGDMTAKLQHARSWLPVIPAERQQLLDTQRRTIIALLTELLGRAPEEHEIQDSL